MQGSWTASVIQAPWRCKMTEALNNIVLIVRPEEIQLSVGADTLLARARECYMCGSGQFHVCLPISLSRGNNVIYFNSRGELLEYFEKIYTQAYSTRENQIRAAIKEAADNPHDQPPEQFAHAHVSLKAAAPLLCKHSKFDFTHDGTYIVARPRIHPDVKFYLSTNYKSRIINKPALESLEQRMMLLCAWVK